MPSGSNHLTSMCCSLFMVWTFILVWSKFSSSVACFLELVAHVWLVWVDVGSSVSVCFCWHTISLGTLQFSQCWVTLKVFCWQTISLGSFVSVSVQFLSLFRPEPSKMGTASRTTIPNMHVGLHRSPFENKYPHIITKVGLQVFLVYLVCTIGLQAVFPTSFMSMQCAVVAVPLRFWSHLVVTICKAVAIYQPHNVGLESSVQYNSIKHADFEGGCSCALLGVHA